MSNDDHQMNVPNDMWNLGAELFGVSNPSNKFREIIWKRLIELVEAKNVKPQPAPEPQPPQPKSEPLHVAVDWEQYGMGYDWEDPDFTTEILPWFIGKCGGEREAEAKVKAKLADGIREPRKWVANLYYKHKRRDVG